MKQKYFYVGRNSTYTWIFLFSVITCFKVKFFFIKLENNDIKEKISNMKLKDNKVTFFY